MKKVKLAIVIIALLAVIVGVVVIVFTPGAGGGIGPIGGEDAKIHAIEKDISERITNAPDNSFCVKAYDGILKSIEFYFDAEPANKDTYTRELQYAYTEKFVRQAMYVFDNTVWNSQDVKTIKNEYKRCYKFSPDNSDLCEINRIIGDYDRLSSFNNKICNACKQCPKCVSKDCSNYLYVNDDWDITTTNELIANIPAASSKVTNSPVYRNTRRSEVERRLREAHENFIEQKMDCADKEAQGFNYNPSRHGDWEVMSSNLYKNLNTYKIKWGRDVKHWQKRIANWERYAMQRD